MRSGMLVFVACVGCLAAACSDDESGGGAGCTADACDALVRTCQMAPRGLAPRQCHGAPDAPADLWLSSCVASCRALGAGRQVSCYAENVALCEQANACGGDSSCVEEAREELLARCSSGEPEPDADCARSCYSAEGACAAACPTDAYAACESCTIDCAREALDCEAACPPAAD